VLSAVDDVKSGRSDRATKRLFLTAHQTAFTMGACETAGTAAMPLLAMGPIGWVGYAFVVGTTAFGVNSIYKPFHKL
jgi:hypothetical protein